MLKHFQTRQITAMDIWLLLSMMFVAAATFEYAVLLAILFGKSGRVNGEKGESRKEEKKCKRVDRRALKMFLGTYILAVTTYFFIFLNSD